MEHHTQIDSPIRLQVTAPSKKKVVICTPTIKQPHPEYLKSLERSIHKVIEAGWDEGSTWIVGCAYISAARSIMLRRALDAGATDIVFIDHDISWDEGDLLRLIETEGEVVAGTYRFKQDEEEYMGRRMFGPNGGTLVRDDGCVQMLCIPAGFMKITRKAVNTFARAYPELLYGEEIAPGIDLFNHGAIEGVWFGEDYAFSKRWNEKCGEIWVIPDLNLVHHDGDKPYPGNYHQYLLRHGK